MIGISLAVSPASAQDIPRTHVKAIGVHMNTQPWTSISVPLWEEKLPQVSGGRITADLVSITTLGLQGTDVFRLVKLGVADFLDFSGGYASGDIPEGDGNDLAGLIQDAATLKKVSAAYRPTLDRVFGKVGVTILSTWPSSGQMFWCAIPITGLAGMKGKKVRVFTASLAEFVQAFGGVPVTMGAGEVIPAIQRKVIDCAITGSANGNLAKWHEVTTHLYPMIVSWSAMLSAANTNSWNKIDPKARAVIQKALDTFAEPTAWKQADETTQHGIWCTVGDPRCDVNATAPRAMSKANLTLVPVSAADDKERLRIIEQNVLPNFAKRCGKACAEDWNNTVGKMLGLKAPTG
ncbi:MAG: TRAP transporter substrate-binding protein [Proteobacteria bacterium]|nr:TRAP transporter substrate-binding protein [Pseudomonadota bacterium]